VLLRPFKLHLRGTTSEGRELRDRMRNGKGGERKGKGK